MTAINVLPGASLTEVAKEWNSINWKKIETEVKRLQMRIAKATREKRLGKVKALQWILSHSLFAKLLAIKQVTQNKGAKTPGIDKVLWRTSQQKLKAVKQLKRRGYKAKPLRRVYIPKKNGKYRPLGIPTMKDRAMQALYLMTLEPIAEQAADKHSYGFRRMRSTADAIRQTFDVLVQETSSPWILEGDIKNCFDNINHNWMLDHIPLDKRLLQQWLKAGYMERLTLHPTEIGTPQGGIISPTLANMALDGLENIIENITKQSDKVHLVRYADDFIITGSTKIILQKVKSEVERFLMERGLSLSVEKTKITHINDGFDFLGFNIRKYGKRLLVKPGKKNIKELLADIRYTIKSQCNATSARLISLLNPKIRGWANYYRHCVAKKIFSYIDHHIFQALWRWATKRHPSKSKRWVKRKYFRTQNMRDWIFFGIACNQDGSRAQYDLFHAARVPIKRHIKIRRDANPFDPSYAEYFYQRAQRMKCQKLQAKISKMTTGVAGSK